MNIDRHYLKADEVAERLSLTVSAVYKLCKAGEIPSIRIGPKTVRIPAAALERYLERLEQGEPRFEPAAVERRDVHDVRAELERQAEAFIERAGIDAHTFVARWRAGEIQDTPENADLAIAALSLRTALDTHGVKEPVSA